MTGKAQQKLAGRSLTETPPASTADMAQHPEKAQEVGGRKGPEPTRYGDWEVGGICSDF